VTGTGPPGTTGQPGATATVHILGQEAAGLPMVLDRLRDPQTGGYLAPVRPDGLPVAGPAEGQTAYQAAIVDTGLDTSHPWIAATLAGSVDLTGQGEQDRNGHGTWVAVLFLWAAPMPASVLNVKALGDDGTGTPDALARGIRWAARRSAGAIVVSAGVSQPWCQADCLVCRAALDAAAGGAHVSAAAGNVAGETTCPAKAGLLHPQSGVRALGALDPQTAAPQPYSGVGSAYLYSPAPTLLPVADGPAGTGPAGWDTKHAEAAASAQVQLALNASITDPDQAVRWFTEVVTRCSDATDPRIRAYAALALVDEGFMFRQYGRHDEELGCYQSVIERWGADPADLVRNQVNEAHLKRAETLQQRGDTSGALADYAAIIDGSRPAPGAKSAESLARALFKRGLLLRELHRPVQAAGDFGRLVDDYAAEGTGNAAEGTGNVEVYVTQAMVNLALLRTDQGDDAGAITQYDAIWARYADSPRPPRRRAAAIAMFNRGNGLRRLGREQDAVAAYDLVIARFGGDPELAEIVAGARTNRDLNG
jgi:tetratricopeptide (TPR) repeat protein